MVSIFYNQFFFLIVRFINNAIVLAAINCTVNSVLTQGPFGKEVINCTINKQFPVKVKANGLCTKAPVLKNGTTILILGYNSSCERNCFSSYVDANDMEYGTYIIAGTYVTREVCKDTLWYTKHKDLIAPITSKINDRFDDFVTNGNRLRNCLAIF